LLLRQYLGRPASRRAVVFLAALGTVAAAPAARADSGHSRLVPLPGVSPPTLRATPMRWSHSAPAPAPAARFAGGRAVVGLAAGVDARAMGLRVVRRLAALRLAVLAGTPRELAALAARPDPRLRYVEPLRSVAPAHVRNDPLSWQTDPRSGAPYEWAFHAVGVDAALSLSKGDPSILVGIVDSGVANVPDLRGKVAETFWDTRSNASADDVIGHGTFVASVIGARNDDGFGLAGFCGACRLAVYKAIPLNDLQIAAGIERLTDAHVRVINLSLVQPTASQDIIDAINYALAAGVLVVAASGNEGQGTVDFPASVLQSPNGTAGGGLAVGASDAAGNRLNFSNWGSQLSLLAPGGFDARCNVGILGAIPPLATDFDNRRSCDALHVDAQGNRYAYASGTSFAAPAVAGIAALVWAAAPTLTNVQIASVLEQTATRPAATGWLPTVGWGVIDARAAVESVLGRTAVDSLALSKLRVAGVRTPGKALTATVDATWSDATPVVAGATPTCRLAIGGKALRARAALSAGVVSCAFTLPLRSAGKRVAGSVAVTAAAAQPVTASFAFSVRGRH
jgi:subtilisin family serine protease